ncbi:PAS domain S-box protein [Gimesia sp.]|uniref:PAS domain-containing hybrid sensor histidine kinase/response regulator n=1 Tax=Gimesia sp. TaxID=2024833 RepID=UPI003A8D39B3
MCTKTVMKVRARRIGIACLSGLILTGIYGSLMAAEVAPSAATKSCPDGHCAQRTAKPELQAEGPAVFFSNLFDTSGFPQRWYCGTWSTDVGWLHIISDFAIFGAYFAIPVVLLYFLLQRKDLPFPKIIWLFAAFILFCGFGHLIEAGIFWWPIYRFSGLIKACTAIVSWITVLVLIRLVPEALKLPSTALLARELQQSKARLDFALESGQIGVWEWNLKTDTLLWDRRTREIFDIEQETTDLCFADFSQRLHPEDRDYVKKLFDECIESGAPYHAQYRVIHTNGSVHYIQLQGRVVYDKDGIPEQFIGVCHDFTNKQLQENALTESELNFRSTFEQAAMGIAHVSPDGRWLRVNQGFCKIVGYQSEELLKVRIHELSHPDELDADLENMTRMLAGEIESYTIEKRYLTRDRTAVWTNMTVSLLRHQSGEAQYFIFVIENIQGRKEAEKALQMYNRKVKKLSLVASKTKHSVIISDAHGHIEWVNDAFTSLTGYTLTEVMEKNLCEILQGPNSDPESIAVIKEHLDRKESIATELLHYDRLGQEYWIELKIDPVLDDDDILLNFIATQVDITARKHSELALRKANVQFNKLLQADILGIMTCHFDGTIEQANHELLRILGYTADDLEAGLINGKELTPPEWRECDQNMIDEITRTGSVKPLEKEYFRKDGSRVPVVLGMTRLEQDEDLCLCFVLDATTQKEAEEKLKAAKQTAEEASQAKSEFLANMSHELRTPLNGVIGMTELLAGTHLNQRQQEFVDACRNSGESLLNLINDILDFSKIEAGKMDLDLHDFDLENVLMDTVSTMVWRTTEKNLELPCFVDPESRLMLKGDSYRLRQILVNLVGNAIKFTDSGEVVVRTRTVARQHEQIRIHFSVTDTGIGISQSKLNRLFQSFSQVDASTTRNYGGTGLGLVISQNLVELMGGTIGIESQEGVGSNFWFEIPFEVVTSGSVPFQENNQLVGKRALVVDDNQTSRTILIEYLREWGLETVAVSSVSAAKAAIQRASNRRTPFDIIVTDFEMPDQNGLETGRALKRSDIPIILLTSSPDTQLDPVELQECHITLTMRKPIHRHKLFDTIYQLLGTPINESPKSSSVSYQQKQICSQGKRVLLAEDNRINQLYVTELIKQLGCQCDTVWNGQQAVDAVLQNDYDLVLMDCQMPELDGLEATRRIRELEKQGLLKNKLPVIALTANAIKGDRERCLEAGMDEYLSKPVQKDQITMVMEQFLQQNRAVETKPHSAYHPPGAETHQPGIDTLALTKFCSGNLELINSLLDELESSGEARVTQIRKSAEQSDVRGVSEAAHSLKGATSILCATRLQYLSTEIEQVGEASELTEIANLIDEVSQEMQRCLEEIPRIRAQLEFMDSDAL